MLLQDVGHSTHRERAAQVLLEAQGAYTVHTRRSGHDDQRGKLEVRRELIGSEKGQDGDSLAPPYTGV